MIAFDVDEVNIGGGNSCVDVDRFPTSNLFNAPFLQESKEFHLQGSGQLINLI